MLVKSKLNIIETLMSKALSHDEFIAILKEKDKKDKQDFFKMYLISAEGYKNAEVDVKMVRKTREIWASMKDVRSGMGVKIISDLDLKELRGVLKIKNLTEEHISEYKITER